MSVLEICRICACYADPVLAIDLFDKKRNSLLSQIKDITGYSLKNEENLPRNICLKCQENLKTAQSFRNLCLDSQSYFSSKKYKEQFVKHNRIQCLNENKAVDCKPEKGDQEEYVVIIKSETSSTHGSDKVLNTSLESASNYRPNLINETSNDVCLQKGRTKRREKKIQPKRTTKPNSMVHHKKNTVTARKAEEKIEFICDQCGNHFNCRHHFLTHLRRHTNDKPFKCEVCPNKFYTHSELKRHMRRHTGERPFACIYCERRFTDYSTRIKHERTHTNERPYTCSQCGKAFTNSYVLKNHMLVHTGERSFKCSLCNRAFQRQTHLTVHYRSIMHKQMVEKQQLTNGAEIVHEIKPIKYTNNENTDISQ